MQIRKGPPKKHKIKEVPKKKAPPPKKSLPKMGLKKAKKKTLQKKGPRRPNKQKVLNTKKVQNQNGPNKRSKTKNPFGCKKGNFSPGQGANKHPRESPPVEKGPRA